MPRDAPISIAPISATAATLPQSGDDPGFGLELVRGAPVGRYLVLEKIGAGGMGVVYAAYDPQLDRKIALKALHAASDPERDTAGRSRLIREAKAMARLSHPNVVAVYDVLVEGDQVLVAMELVEGESLRDWLDAKRPWRDVLGAFVQAGHGLAAAHAAGMVHRDFKLDNVFVGNDGRVRVGDFGLARSSSKHRPITKTSKRDDLGPLVSREGMLAGTPAYMAPDQLLGDPADVLSDQFSFCTALYEGLYGSTPFEAKNLEELLDSIVDNRVRPPPAGSTVPGWLRGIVERGLRARPKDRFASMNELLAALEKDPRRARLRRTVVGLVALATAGTAILVAHERRAESLACGAQERRLDGVWDAAKKRAVHDAFVATGRPYAEDTFARTARVLDAYAGAWGSMAVASCEDRRGSPAERALLAERVQCEGDRLSELRALSSVLSRAEGETVDRAVQGARALPALEVCAGKDPLRGQATPSDPTVKDEAAALEEQMNVATALETAGRYADGMALATKNLAEAERIAFRPLTARALLSYAQHQVGSGDLAGAEQSFHRASVAAEAAGDLRVAAAAWIGAAFRAADRGEFARADEGFDHASAWIDRVGDADDGALRAELLLRQGERLNDEGKYDAARTLSGKSFALFERLGNDKATLAMNDLGIEADLQGHYDEARSYYEGALQRYEQLLGPDHPKIANELNNLGLMAGDQGRLDEAARALERSLRIREGALGAEHPDIGRGLYNLALVYIAQNRYGEALALAQRAIPITEKGYGADSSDMAFALGAMVGALNGLHRSSEAIAPGERELSIRLRTGPPNNLADAQCDLGSALLQSGKDVARGRTLLRQAKQGFDAVGRTNRLEEIDDLMKASYARNP